MMTYLFLGFLLLPLDRELVGMQPGDVPVTYADRSALERDYGFRPSVDIRTGLLIIRL